jgi:putative membrane protein
MLAARQTGSHIPPELFGPEVRVHLIVRWLVGAASLAVAAWAVPGIHVEGAVALIVAALVIGLLNALVKPVLVILTLPLTIVTLGLFLLVLNALLLWVAAALSPGFDVDGFLSAFLGALIMAVVGWVLARLA